MDYPAYNQFVKDVPEYVQKVIEQSRKYEVAFTDALDASQKALDEYHTGRFGNPDRDPYPVFIEHAVEALDPFKTGPLVETAYHNLYRTALKSWARQGGYNVSNIWKWLDDKLEQYGGIHHFPYSDNVWDEFASLFPIELPRDEHGKVDPAKLDQMTDLQRALITSQAAEVAETCAHGGGDDTWFDYLPNGILTLRALQSEEWATVWADYINTIEAAPDEDGDDWEERMGVEEQLAERYDFFIQDTTSHLLNVIL
jgi:hypothetical protein